MGQRSCRAGSGPRVACPARRQVLCGRFRKGKGLFAILLRLAVGPHAVLAMLTYAHTLRLFRSAASRLRSLATDRELALRK